jgi:hypothetical protein
MNEITILARQTSNTYNWVNRLLAAIPFEQWEETPDVINSNITWQAGHLVVSFYFHTIMVVKGHQMDVLQQMPMKEYSDWFTRSGAADARGKVASEKLLADVALMQVKSLAVMASLNDAALDNPLVPILPHPVARTIREALEWNVQHTMWHCGQIGTISRALGRPYTIVLQEKEAAVQR